MTRLILAPRPPFDFAKTAAIFAPGDPQIRTFSHGTFRQPFLTPDGPALAELRSTGTRENPRLALRIRSDRPVTAEMSGRILALVTRIFSLDDDPSLLPAALADDPLLSGLAVRLRGVRVPATPTVFEAAAVSIIDQQISLAVARSMGARLIRAAGRTVSSGPETWYCFPEPAALAGMTDAGFRACRLSQRKGEYLRGIAKAIVQGELDLESFRTKTDTGEILRELEEIRGIGPWTAEMVALRGLHRPDAFPADDVGLRKVIASFFCGGRRITADDARKIAARWGAYQGFAVYYLLVAGILGIHPPAGDPGSEGRAGRSTRQP